MGTINSPRSQHGSSFFKIGFTHVYLDINHMYNRHKCFVQMQITVYVPQYKRKKNEIEVHQTLLH